VRVPFRSREQKRGRHPLDGAAPETHPGVGTNPDPEAAGLSDDPPIESEISRVFKEGSEDPEFSIGSGPDEPEPEEGSFSNVEATPHNYEPAHDEQTESLERQMDDLIEVPDKQLASDPPSGDLSSEDAATEPLEDVADEDGPDGNVTVEAESSSVVAAPADSSTDPSGASAGSPPNPKTEQIPAASPRTDARMTGSSVTDGVERERPPLPRVIAVANQKGGVGKTTTAVNLGAGLAELGFRVLVIDLDPQGNATTGLGIDARNFEYSMYDVIMKDVQLEDCIEPTSLRNLFVAPATIDLAGAEIELVPSFSREFKLRKAISTVVDDFDYVLIDCPPSLGLITINGLAAANEVLVPIQCEYYALEGLSQLLRNVQLVQSNLNETLEVSTIVLTMYDARTKLADQVASEVRMHFGAKVCRIVIPRTVRISEAPSFGQPITVFDPTSRGAIAYRELAKEVSGGET
jgi:chromosome partitioning protein